MNAWNVVKTALNNNLEKGYFDDLVAIGSRIFPIMCDYLSASFVAQYILDHRSNIWGDVVDLPGTQWREKHPFVGSGGKVENPTFSETDCLEMFKDYTRRWAARKKTGSPEGDWVKAQEEMAELNAPFIRGCKRRYFVNF